jgi:hypothetical protein
MFHDPAIAELDQIGAGEWKAHHVLVERACGLHVLGAEIDVVQTEAVRHLRSPAPRVVRGRRSWMSHRAYSRCGSCGKEASSEAFLIMSGRQGARMTDTELRESCHRFVDPIVGPTNMRWRCSMRRTSVSGSTWRAPKVPARRARRSAASLQRNERDAWTKRVQVRAGADTRFRQRDQ